MSSRCAKGAATGRCWPASRPAGAVERAVSRHRGHLPAAVAAQAQAPSAATAPEQAPPPAVPRTGRIADRTRARHADVHRLLAEDRGYRDIAAALGLSRNTVRRFARAASPGELLVNDGTGKRPGILDEHEAYLRGRWNSGCTNAAQLWQEIRDRGYTGSRRQVRHYLARFRGNHRNRKLVKSAAVSVVPLLAIVADVGDGEEVTDSDRQPSWLVRA